MQTINVESAKSATENKLKEAPNFGAGRYSELMSTLHKQSQRLFGLNEEQAEKFARDAATTHGLAMADAKVEAKAGKASKDGKVTLSEASKVKGVTSKPCLALMHAIQWCGEAGKHGLSYGGTKWQLDEVLGGYVESL